MHVLRAWLAAQHVILNCEELVDESVTLSPPNRILFPETKVVAVVHEPGGAYPSPVQGYCKTPPSTYRRGQALTPTPASGGASLLDTGVQ